MKVYVILESFADYKHNSATSFGVFKTFERAKEYLPQAVLDRYGYDCIEDWENDYGDCFENYMSTDRESWSKFDGDDDIRFFIQEDELED